MSEIKIGDFIIRNYRGHKEVMTVEGRRSIATFWGPLGKGFVTEEQYQRFVQLFASAPDLQRELCLAHTLLVGMDDPLELGVTPTKKDIDHRLSEIDKVIAMATGEKPLGAYLDTIMAYSDIDDLKRKSEQVTRERDALLGACIKYIECDNDPMSSVDDYEGYLYVIKKICDDINKEPAP